MKRKILQSLAMLLLFFVLNSCKKSEVLPDQSKLDDSNLLLKKIEKSDNTFSANNANGNTIVSGGGTFRHLGMFGEPIGDLIHFTVHAIRKKDGSVTGKLVIKYPSITVHGDIDCMFVSSSSPNSAAANLTGVMTKVEPSNDYYFVGAKFVFSVFDRGEGNNAPPDRLISISNIFDSDCSHLQSEPTVPLIGGNIQIKL